MANADATTSSLQSVKANSIGTNGDFAGTLLQHYSLQHCCSSVPCACSRLSTQRSIQQSLSSAGSVVPRCMEASNRSTEQSTVQPACNTANGPWSVPCSAQRLRG